MADGSGSRQKKSVMPSLFMEVNSLEVEEELSTMATLCWADGVWLGRWEEEEQHGSSKSSKYRHGGKWEGQQEQSCARRVIWASSGRNGTH